jgi:hypothetical protein
MEQDNLRAFARAHEVNRQTPYRNMRSQQWGTFAGVQVVFQFALGAMAEAFIFHLEPGRLAVLSIR